MKINGRKWGASDTADVSVAFLVTLAVYMVITLGFDTFIMDIGRTDVLTCFCLGGATAMAGIAALKKVFGVGNGRG